MTTQPTKRAVIYARVSSENDRQDTSRQITDLQKFSEANDMEIVKIYEEHISGAKKNEERQVLTEHEDNDTWYSFHEFIEDVE